MELEVDIFDFLYCKVIDADETVTIAAISSEFNIDLERSADILKRWKKFQRGYDFDEDFVVSGLTPTRDIFVLPARSTYLDEFGQEATIFERLVFSAKKSTSGPSLETHRLTDLKYKTNCRYKFGEESTSSLETDSEEENECNKKSEIKNKSAKKMPLGSPAKSEENKKENIKKSNNLKKGGNDKKTSSIASFFTAKPVDKKKCKSFEAQFDPIASNSSQQGDEEVSIKAKRNLEEKDTEITSKRRKVSKEEIISVESSQEEDSSKELDNSGEGVMLMCESDLSNSVDEYFEGDKKAGTSKNKFVNAAEQEKELEVTTYEDEDGYLVTQIRDKVKPVTPEKNPSSPVKVGKISSPKKPGKPVRKQISIADYFDKIN